MPHLVCPIATPGGPGSVAFALLKCGNCPVEVRHLQGLGLAVALQMSRKGLLTVCEAPLEAVAA